MKIEYAKCNCDYCNTDMSENDYDKATQITLRVDVPNQKGGAGECNGLKMVICNQCAESIGIVNNEIHSGQMGTRERILKALKEHKLKIMVMFSNKK